MPRARTVRTIALRLLGPALLLWTLAQAAWLRVDERPPDGDEAGNLGAVELFWGFAHEQTAARVLIRSYTEDFGDYPAAYPAALGVLGARLGLRDLDGDGPALLGLSAAWLTVLGTCLLALLAARLDGLEPGAVLPAAGLLLLCSPLFTGLQRHLMLENGVTAWTTLAAAGVLAVALAARRGSGRGAWAALGTGLAAGLALLTKQPAALALAAPALASATLPPPEERGRTAAAAGAALVVCLVVAGPWYVGRLSREGGYLLGSAAANPDAMGPLRQVLYYPLVVVQQFWGPALWATGLVVLLRAPAGDRRPGRALRFLLAAAVALVVMLILVPKKYPRLLLPALPWLAVAGGLLLARARPAGRRLVLGVAAAAWAASMLPLGPARALGSTSLGLGPTDERCPQRWIEAPDPAGVDWAGLLAAVEAAGGREDGLTVGAIRWPVPPCGYRTTHDLGEHLRVRARRAGFEARIQAGEAFEQAGWPEGPPALLLHEGTLDCSAHGEACARLGVATERGRFPIASRDWETELVLYARGEGP